MVTAAAHFHAQWLNAATGGFSGVVRHGAEFESAGLGVPAADKSLPAAHEVQGGALYVSTPWGLREATPETRAAGKLINELTALQRGLSAEGQKEVAEDVAALYAAIRRCDTVKELPELTASIRAEIGDYR